jgi:hypothetical protein
MDKHESIRRRLASLALGELPEREQAEVRAHVDRCDPCRAELTQIERLLDRAGERKSLSADESLHESARTRLFAAIRSGNKVETTARRHIRWALLGRRIVKNRMTKLAAAVIVVAAIVLGVRSLDGTPVKAVEFSEITKAMGEVPWMRMTQSGFQDDGSLPSETWFGFESKVQAEKDATGYVRFESVTEHRRLEYSRSSNIITMTYLEEPAMNLDSPTLWLESLYKALEERGARTTSVRMGDYQGRKVQIQELSRSDGNERESVTLYIDPKTKRLHAGKGTRVDGTGKVAMIVDVDFDYPPTGPGGIYDLGVPRDAKIVSNMPGWNVHTARERYRQAWGETSRECGIMERYWRIRDEATREYLAVIAHNTAVNITDAMNMVDVDYKSGPRHRQERHSVFESGQAINDEVWAKSKQQLGDTFESLLTWSRAHHAGRGRITIDLYDGQYDCSVTREHDNWGPPSKHYHPEGSIAPEIALGDLAWPEISSPARIIEDDYAAEHKLICFERQQQGLLSHGIVSPPGRFLYYLDPAWDYLCRRKVTEWRPDAPWQKDAAWLNGIDPTQVPNGSITVEEITEAFQAPNGHWYPKAIVERQTGIRKDYRQAPLGINTIRRVYLDLSPEFPEGVFDANKLPGQ